MSALLQLTPVVSRAPAVAHRPSRQHIAVIAVKNIVLRSVRASRSGKQQPSKQEIAQALRRLSRNYNMLKDYRCEQLAYKIVENPVEAQADLKERVHKALVLGRDSIQDGDYEAANSHFAYAYQMRCVCDYIWRHYVPADEKQRVLEQRPDAEERHQEFVKLSRKFSQYAKGRLHGREKREVFAAIEELR